MKIIAEFNSNEELISFARTFGGMSIGQACVEVVKEEVKATKETKVTKKKEEIKVAKVEEPKAEKVEAEVVEVIPPTQEEVKDVEPIKEEEPAKEVITKEVVRAAFTKLIQAGKQAEAKHITLKYGANKLAELKEEDYAAAHADVEALL
ncbi:hypothetical protein [Clostridium gasigenes]|uniref:Uncharacterized protein n=1 Tax=Clostridium gasigenes TaxID=94869 RepID=A0A7X0VT26_9CLOT|nr:hypothetical protein [Clostridium gasigenes]MBB6716340.1 hypothetical protein [Clostridium gasigenes]